MVRYIHGRHVTPVSTFPLQVSGNGRYLQTAAGQPFLVNGSSAWALIAGISTAHAKAYVDQRVVEGINTMLVGVIFRGLWSPPTTESWQDTVPAFLTPGNYSTPNPTYFAHADEIIDYLGQKGVFTFLLPVYLGWRGSTQDGSWSIMQADSDAHLAEFGTFVANRYKDKAHVGWCAGGDQYAEFRSSVTAAREQALMGAIKSIATTQLYTAHLDSSGDTPRFDSSGMNSWDAPEYRYLQTPPYGVNGHYFWAETDNRQPYDHHRIAYTQTPTMPTMRIDGPYRGEGNGSLVELRSYQYRAMCEGCCGGTYGDGPSWYHDFNYTTTNQGITENGYWFAFWSGLPWHTLAPDISNTYVTAGRGTYGTAAYVCAAASATLLVAYLPSGAASNITVAMSQFSQVMRARWYNPTTGAYTLIDGGIANSGTRSFANPGNNGSGDSDWVLVLDQAVLGTLIIDGDSLTEDHGYPPDVTTWPVHFASDFPHVQVINSAHAGDSFQPELIPGAATRVDAHYNSARRNVALVFCGTNDLGDQNRTAAQTYDLLLQWCAGRRAAHPGIKIAVCNLIARPDIEPRRTEFNALLAANGLVDFDYLIDLETAAQDWVAQPSWWNGDHVHLTDAGQVVLAAAIRAALDPVFA